MKKNVFKRIYNAVTGNKDTTLDEQQVDDVLLRALIHNEEITREQALTVPVISSSVGLICDIFAILPIKLYKKVNKDGIKQVEEVADDSRVKIINADTRDTLDGFQFKKAICEDYLLGKGGYAYIKKNGNKFVGLYYVEDDKISFQVNTNPIFKFYKISVDGKEYNSFDFIKLLRNSKNGRYGTGYIKEINKSLQSAYKRITYEIDLMKTSGNKKGFLTSQKHLDEKAMQSLKKAWNDYFTGNSSCVILNDGMGFQDASNTSVENQLNEKNKTFSDEMKNLFRISDNNEKFIREALMPIATAFCTALNRDFLLEKEKDTYFFDADYTELAKASIKERFEAYKTAIEAGIYTRNEVRYAEKKNPLKGLDMINLGLGSVLLNPDTGEIYTPNTDSTVKMGETIERKDVKGGEQNEE